MGNGMSQILPGLYLGNFIDAKDLEQLSRNKITHIVSIHESPQPLLQDITYLRIPLPDTPEANIKRHFKECISFIHQCRLRGGNCLVHCLAGISRSTTVVVAYVMAVTELSSQEVLDAIRTIRPVANPNPGFRQQLAEFNGSAARKVRRHLKQRYGTSRSMTKKKSKPCCPRERRSGQDGGSPARTGPKGQRHQEHDPLSPAGEEDVLLHPSLSEVTPAQGEQQDSRSSQGGTKEPQEGGRGSAVPGSGTKPSSFFLPGVGACPGLAFSWFGEMGRDGDDSVLCSTWRTQPLHPWHVGAPF